MNFKYIKEFIKADGRFSYMHDIYKNEILVGLSNGQKFIITQEKYNLFKATYMLLNSVWHSVVNFSISDEESLKNSIETIYKLATVYDDKQSEEDSISKMNYILSDYKSLSDKESIKYSGGENNMNFKNSDQQDLDFINDYKLMKSIERSINDNLDVIASAFYKYTKDDAPAEFINDDNAKVFFFVEREDSIELNFEFALGEDVYSYTFTRRGIRLLDDYDKQAVMTLANLIEHTVKIWLNKFSTKDNFSELSDNLLFATENIKIMIGLMVRTIDIYT
jgi:hypothetical protein|nr:MAG TPA: hypothetical protein [Caudoviricetes sp.]